MKTLQIFSLVKIRVLLIQSLKYLKVLLTKDVFKNIVFTHFWKGIEKL